MDSSSPKYGEKASYYWAVCLETGEVEWIEVAGNSNAGTSVAFLEQLRGRHGGRLNVIWDNAPAHRGEALREYLQMPDLNLRLVNLPGYSPAFNAPIFDQSRHLGLGERRGHRQSVPGDPAGGAQERVGNFLTGLASRKDEVRRRCRTVLQSRAKALLQDSQPNSSFTANAHPTVALV